MAKLVGPEGRVFAYEPASEPRGLLAQSRDINGLRNLEIVDAALSDNAREGHLVFGNSSELNALGAEGEGAGERVRVTSLDLEDAARGWQAVDFVKIDAEGEEERVVRGGAAFFARHSPLVQFEIKAGNETDLRLRNLFPQLGYGIYRLLPGAPVLVPLEDREIDKAFELNLYAARPDRAAILAAQGLLAESVSEWGPQDAKPGSGLALLMAQPCGALMNAAGIGANVPLDPDYRASLDAYAAWRSSDLPLAQRVGALGYVFRTLQKLRSKGETASRMSTLARVAFEFGQRTEALDAAGRILDALRAGTIKLNEPFWPASPRFDTFVPPGQIGQWFAVATAEMAEQQRGFSSMFTDASARVGWLAKHPMGSIEMERRRALVALRDGAAVEVSPRLHAAGLNHLNADVWSAGLPS
jgi:FkbM family methyltransferase